MRDVVAGDFILSPKTKTLTWQGKEVELHAKQVRILETLMKADGETVSKDTLQQHMFILDAPDPTPTDAKTQIFRMREKVKKAFGINFHDYLVTDGQKGYYFQPNPQH